MSLGRALLELVLAAGRAALGLLVVVLFWALFVLVVVGGGGE